MAKTNNIENVLKGYKIQLKLLKFIIGCLAVIITLLLLLNVYYGSKAKTIPWVVELTSEGKAYYHENAVFLQEDWVPNEATQRYFLSQYIQNLRSVSSDYNTNMLAGRELLSKSASNAFNTISPSYMDTNNLADKSPLVRMKRETVVIPSEEVSVIKYDTDKWKIVWRESTYDNNNVLIKDEQFEGIFLVALVKTERTDTQKKYNPIGLYVLDWDISLIRNLME